MNNIEKLVFSAVENLPESETLYSKDMRLVGQNTTEILCPNILSVVVYLFPLLVDAYQYNAPAVYGFVQLYEIELVSATEHFPEPVS